MQNRPFSRGKPHSVEKSLIVAGYADQNLFVIRNRTGKELKMRQKMYYESSLLI
jgi:hypothetical protein